MCVCVCGGGGGGELSKTNLQRRVAHLSSVHCRHPALACDSGKGNVRRRTCGTPGEPPDGRSGKTWGAGGPWK